MVRETLARAALMRASSRGSGSPAPAGQKGSGAGASRPRRFNEDQSHIEHQRVVTRRAIFLRWFVCRRHSAAPSVETLLTGTKDTLRER